MAIKRAIKAGNKSIISFKKAIKVGVVAQLLDKNTYYNTQTKLGITATNNGDGSWTINGTATANGYINFSAQLSSLVGGHKMLICGNKENSNFHLALLNQPITDIGTGAIGIVNQSLEKSWGISWKSGAVINNVTITPQLFDLTEMFGVGHEPATVDEFKVKFPEAYYPYQRAVLTVYNKVVRPCARKGEVVQLVSAGDFDKSKSDFYGVTYTNNEDGSWTLNGTCTTSANYNILYHANSSKLPIIKDHVYLVLDNRTGKINTTGNATVQILNAQQTFIIGTSDNQEVGYQFRTSSITTMCYVRVRIEQSITYNNVKLTPQLFDLTAMYGAGNEPKTLAEFRKDFPENYYPYSPIQTKNLLKMVINNAQHYVASMISGDVWTIIPNNSGGYGQLKAHLPAGTYTLSGVICNNNEFSTKINYTILSEAPNAGNIFALGYLQNNLTFTLDKEKDFYILLYPAFGIDKSLGVYRKAWYKLQIEKGSVATDYVPHDYI
nr:MAG TPA: hypothetical protein [Caudoviricetes sp.]